MALVLSRGLRPVRAYPAHAIGTAAFATLFACIASNALINQSGRHKHPILSTRSGDAGPVADADDVPDGLMPVPFVVEIQTALADAGYYAATIDGRPGKATAAAIRTYQGDHDLPIDGMASPRLLATIRQAAHPPLAPISQETASRIASLSGEGDGVDRAPKTVVVSDAVAEKPSDDLVRRIQDGLTAANVADLKADGIFGSYTASAIRTFEASQGLEVTGLPSVELLGRLEAVGAGRR